MISLFGGLEEVDNAFEFTLNPQAKEIPRDELLQWEKELIGVYISKHPLANLTDLFKKGRVTHTTAEITEEMDKQKVGLGGAIRDARPIPKTKANTQRVIHLESMYC